MQTEIKTKTENEEKEESKDLKKQNKILKIIVIALLGIIIFYTLLNYSQLLNPTGVV